MKTKTNHLGLLAKAKTSQVVTPEMVKELSEDDPLPVKPVDGLAYQKRIRAEWKGRLRVALGLLG